MEKTTVTTPAVLPDLPAVEDKLNFGPYARTLLDIILNPDTQTPLTIGIFGSWGSGKTSLMKMIEAGLKSTRRDVQEGRQTYTIWFNAWLYSKEDTLWRALVMQVLTGMRRIRDLDDTARAELDQLADQLYRAVGPSELGTLSITAAELLKEEGTSAAHITLALQHGLDFLENIAEARQQGELAAAIALRDQVRRATALLEQERIESLERFQRQFEALIKKHVLSRGYLVIFVDDLDRCLPDKAVEVLEAIKLFLDVPGCVFVLGIDRDVVERGIRLRYGEMGGTGDRESVQLYVDSAGLDKGAARYRAFLQDFYTDADDIIDGGRYLEKIVQIPFVLPPISPQAMGSFVAQLTPNLPDARCGLVFVRGLEPNPRQVKRALNIFALLWALAQNQPYLADRVSPVRLAKLVVLQQRHADLYEQLRESPAQLIAWERAFRVRRDREGYQAWAQASGFDWQNAGSLWSLEAPFPAELEAYENLAALESLLTVHALTGEDAQEANFVDMTPEQVHDLIFLTYTAEGGMERQVEEPVTKAVEWPVSEEGLAAPEIVPVHEFLRFSEKDVGYIAQRALSDAGRMADALGRGAEPDEGMLEQLAKVGFDLHVQLLGSAVEFGEMLAQKGRTVQVLFRGAEGPLMARLPWEMVFEWEKDPSVEGIALDDFWGGRHVIERPLMPVAVPRKMAPDVAAAILDTDQTLRVGFVLDWGIDANPAMELFAELESETGNMIIEPIEDPEAFRQSLADPADVYVFYGRGWQEVGENVIGIGKGYPLRIREMQSWGSAKRQVGRRALFYFCLQGDPSQEVDLAAWLPALVPLGAGGVVAPLIYTPGEWPLQFMRLFFEQFLEGKAVGEALRDARLRLFEEAHNPLGLLYVHFGPPALRLVRPGEDVDAEGETE